MDTIIFDPTIEQLQTVVASTVALTADTPLPQIHEARIFLRDARVKIEKKGKEYRAEALAHQKAVIAREKELIGIIEPEEKRLKDIEDAANAAAERTARAALLPMRKAELAKLGLEVTDDNQILDLDNTAFVVLLNDLMLKKNEADARAIEEEKAKLARQAEIKAAEEAAVIKERDRLELQRAQQEAARVEKAAQEKRDAELAAQKLIDDAHAEVERIAAKQKADAMIAAQAIEDKKIEDARIEKERVANLKYQAWLASIGYTAENKQTWRFETGDDGFTTAFKKVGWFDNAV